MSKLIAKIAAVVLGIAVLLIAAGSFYTVPQKQYAAVRQFGRIVEIKDTPGLKFKIPFIQNVQRISAATILYDIPASDVITRDKKSMIADNYVLWRVTDPTKYIRTLDAVELRAEERIEAAVYNALKNVISSMSQDEVIEARGERLTVLITEEANSDITDYGIEIIQSEIKSLDLPDDNKESVYERMISERQNIAATYKAEGNAEAQKIRNQADRDVSVMKADARRQAAIIEGEGEAEYMKILEEAYNTADKADFYNYIRSLDALKSSMTGSNKTIILDKDSELAKILYGSTLNND
ncbi:MAG: protease modulator HflC [Lachnospiraceae bacterium]|nr:protease modulator HflC [Lachnospiraceae bacterium]